MITLVGRQVNMIEVVFRMNINLTTITVRSRPRRECVHDECRDCIFYFYTDRQQVLKRERVFPSNKPLISNLHPSKILSNSSLTNLARASTGYLLV